MTWAVEDSKAEKFINLQAPTFTLPSTPSAGNLLLLGTRSRPWQSSPPPAISGWTLLDYLYEGIGGNLGYVFYKVAAGTETTVQLPDSGNGSTDPEVVYVEISGNDATTPYDDSSINSASSTLPLSSGSITPATTTGLLVAIGLLYRTGTLGEPTIASPFSTYTVNTDFGGEYSSEVRVAVVEPGSTSAAAATFDDGGTLNDSYSIAWIGHFLAPAGGGGVSQELTGNSSTAAVGTLDVATEGSVSVTPEGVSATSAVGTIGATAEINASAELTGVSSSGAVGAITAEVGGGTTANLSGNESVASVGALGVSTEVNAFVDLLGNSATGAVGTLIVVTGLQVALSGNAAIGTVGTLGVTAEVNASAALTGVGSSGAVGTLEVTVPIAVSVELTGVGATGAIGSLTAVGAGQVWTEIPPVSTIWTEIS